LISETRHELNALLSVQANGFVTNRKDAATQVEAEMVEVHQQPASATNARKALLQSAQNLSFVRLVRFFELCTNKISFCCFFSSRTDD